MSNPSGSRILEEFRQAMQWKRAARGFQAGPRGSLRMYAGARGTRFNVGLGQSGDSSADAELINSLTRLRASARQLVRDAPYAKRAKVIVVNNVIGGGIGMQCQVKTTRGGLYKACNDEIEALWCQWMEPANCHTGGKFHFLDLERAAMGQVFEAGEIILRKHYVAMGDSPVRLALEFIEPERLGSDVGSTAQLMAGSNTEARMGVEVDGFGRPVAYWIRQRHPGDFLLRGNVANLYERVDAANIIHLYIIDRWPQTRGEPWLHTAIRKLDSIDQYSAAELQAAQSDAAHFGVITRSPGSDGGALANNLQDQQGQGAKPEIQIENGMVQELDPGEEWEFHSPKRPNTAIDPFLRYMLREVAAGVGVSYESLSRDYSQTTYSSGRLSILDDRDAWRVFQLWWLRNFRMPLFKVWLRQAVLGNALATVPIEQYAVDPAKFEAVKFKPRGWSWVDPTKEVEAYKEAIKAGLTSTEDVIAQTANGQDIEDVVEAIKRSNELFADAGIVRDTDPEAFINAPAQTSAQPGDGDGDSAGDSTTNDPPKQRVVSLQAAR